MIDGKPDERPAFLPLSVPEIGGNEWTYIKECLDTNWVSSVGSYVTRFEEAVAARVGVAHGVATASGTAALHTALLVAGVEADDEVLVSTLTFIAPANAIRYVGAHPVFVDATEDDWQMDPKQVAVFLEQECAMTDGVCRNQATGRRVRAIIPVHTLGHPVDMAPLLALAKTYGLVVIEDAAESIGAAYEDGDHLRPVGSMGHLACFSFNGNKVMTCGGGGMLVTQDADLAQRARYLTTQAKDDPVEYEHGEVGYNYRLTNIAAAMGCAQLEQLDGFIQTKRHIATTYNEALSQIPGIQVMPEAPWARSISWMYTVLVNEVEFGMGSRDLLKALAQASIQTRPLWQPMHLSKPHGHCQHLGGKVAEDIHARSLSLPCSTGITSSDLERVIQTISSLQGR